jgi:MSHA biogenesis protein MshO
MNARQAGFTLIELIVALTISVVVVGFIATFIAVPVQSHMAQARRADLAASAEAVTHWLSRDVHGALPNSLRAGVVGGRPFVEMTDVAAVTIYRDAGTEGDPLDIGPLSPPDDQFDVLGLPAAAATHVVVNGVSAPAGIDVASSTITLTPPFSFPGDSPHKRAFLISPATAVVRYECDLAARTLRRFDNLSVGPLAPLPVGTPSRLIARDVTACTFTTRAGNTEHGGLLLIRATISRLTNGATDTLRVMKQLKVEDAA